MTASAQDPILRRLWQYQAERFPLAQHGPLIAIFSLSGLMLSALLRGDPQMPDFSIWLAVTISVILLFFQLRIADEFKDAETDARYRPERAVPRGLVTLTELWALGLGAALVQLVLAELVAPVLIPLLLAVWTYMGLMTVEFFAHAWLSARLGIYMLTHMIVMPLIDFYITAFDWMPRSGVPPHRLCVFLIVSFCNGIVIEIGRKTWAPEMEREGVESYSSVWGLASSCAAWSAALIFSSAGIIFLSATANVFWAGLLVIGSLDVFLLAGARYFSTRPSVKNAKCFAAASGLWVFLSYFWLGPILFWLAR